jgi:hypothetical protein
MPSVGVPDFTVATPPAGAGAQAILQQGAAQQQAQQATTDAAAQNTYNNNVFSQRTMPQLHSSIGAAGQLYSTARANSDAFAQQDFGKQNYDVNSAVQRQLDQLTSARMFTATGLIT